MLGYAVGEVTPGISTLINHILPEDRRATEAALCCTCEARQEYGQEFRSLHHYESVNWLSARGRFLHGDDSVPLRMIGAMGETTEARELADRQAELVAELQHRTRNLMAVVRSMLDKTLAHATDLGEFSNRLRIPFDALARVQGLLSRLDEHDRVTFHEWLRTELSAHSALGD